jgi:glycosyltransferase involved in cell wall biosynthesis
MKETESLRQDIRVAHLTTVHHALDPRIFHKQLKTLFEAGYDVHLVAPRQQSAIIDEIPVHALPRGQGRYRRALLQRHAFHQARKLNADCYHIHDPELIPLAYALKRLTGAAVIYDMHEDYRWHGPVEGRLIRMMERWCFRWADHVILAESSYRSIVDEDRTAATFVGNYVHPFDGAASSAKSKLKGPLRLVYTGVVATDRGLFHMIDLVDSLQTARVDVALDIVGICNFTGQRQRAEGQIDRLNLTSYVRRIGWDSYVPAADMTPYYRAADVGLALFNPDPNYLQSIPTKFFEYLHFGLPIVCSDFPLWRQFIERHECGVVIPPGDAKAGLRVLRRWLNSPAEYRYFSEAAREAAAQYQWSLMGEQLVQLYDDLLGIPQRVD